MKFWRGRADLTDRRRRAMKFPLVLLATCAALSCISCSALRCGHRPTASGAGGYCAEELAEGGKCLEESVFGGKCRVKLTYDSNGKLVDVDTDLPCFKG